MNVHPLDKFTPLTPQELASAPASRADDDPGECVMSVPGDAPPAPSSHPKFGTPSHVWTYRDAHGATLFHVCRFDTANGKEIRPLSFWRATNGRLEWRLATTRRRDPMDACPRRFATPWDISFRRSVGRPSS